MKGFQRLIPMMRLLPEVDLRIAGTGPYEAELRELARGLPNVHFEGLLGGSALARLFHGARAVVVPSLFPETFGYVVLEAFAVRTPVVVDRRAGPCTRRACSAAAASATRPTPSCCWPSAGSSTIDDLRDELADRGYAIRTGEWSETAHLDRYFGLIQGIRAGRSSIPSPHRPPSRLGNAARLAGREDGSNSPT